MNCIRTEYGFVRADAIVAIQHKTSTECYVTVSGRCEGGDDEITADAIVKASVEAVRVALNWDIIEL